MDVRIQHLGKVRFEAGARGHRVISDQPTENGGSDGGMTPPEFLLVSLGTCAGFWNTLINAPAIETVVRSHVEARVG
jgi:putative redox protein